MHGVKKSRCGAWGYVKSMQEQYTATQVLKDLKDESDGGGRSKPTLGY